MATTILVKKKAKDLRQEIGHPHRPDLSQHGDMNDTLEMILTLYAQQQLHLQLTAHLTVLNGRRQVMTIHDGRAQEVDAEMIPGNVIVHDDTAGILAIQVSYR